MAGSALSAPTLTVGLEDTKPHRWICVISHYSHPHTYPTVSDPTCYCNHRPKAFPSSLPIANTTSDIIGIGLSPQLMRLSHSPILFYKLASGHQEQSSHSLVIQPHPISLASQPCPASPGSAHSERTCNAGSCQGATRLPLVPLVPSTWLSATGSYAASKALKTLTVLQL